MSEWLARPCTLVDLLWFSLGWAIASAVIRGIWPARRTQEISMILHEKPLPKSGYFCRTIVLDGSGRLLSEKAEIWPEEEDE